MKQNFFLIIMLLFISFSMSSCHVEQEKRFPAKEITMIIPYPAGGTTDLVGRKLAAAMEKHLTKKIIILNQAGASGSIGTKTVFDAPADGYTLLFSADSLGTQRVMGLSEYSYSDFTPILLAANDPKVMVVKKNSQYSDLSSLISALKDESKKVSMSYTGPGGSGHVQSIIYEKLGLKPALIAYTGGRECLTAVLAGQIDFTNSNYSVAAPLIESGELVLVGICGENRLALHPDVPTLGEILPDAKDYMKIKFTPLSLLAKKDTPQKEMDFLGQIVQKAVEEEDWKSFLESNSIEPLYKKYENLDSMRKFYETWESNVSWMLYEAGVTKYSPEQFSIPAPTLH